MELQKFYYKETEITFDNGDNLMINATEMAKPFGKKVKDWTVNKSTKEFITALESAKGEIPLIESKAGNPSIGGGTWMHEDVAMEFARWLNPMFAIWCNDRIKELLSRGFVATTDAGTEAIESIRLEVQVANTISNHLRDGINIGRQLMNYFREVDGDVELIQKMISNIYKGHKQTKGREKLLIMLERNAVEYSKQKYKELFDIGDYSGIGRYSDSFNSNVILWCKKTHKRLAKYREGALLKENSKLKSLIKKDEESEPATINIENQRKLILLKAGVVARKNGIYKSYVLSDLYKALPSTIDWSLSNTYIDCVVNQGFGKEALRLLDSII